jgi:hypothetical protein
MWLVCGTSVWHACLLDVAMTCSWSRLIATVLACAKLFVAAYEICSEGACLAVSNCLTMCDCDDSPTISSFRLVLALETDCAHASMLALSGVSILFLERAASKLTGCDRGQKCRGESLDANTSRAARLCDPWSDLHRCM